MVKPKWVDSGSPLRRSGFRQRERFPHGPHPFPACAAGASYRFQMKLFCCCGRKDQMTASIDFKRERPFSANQHRHEDTTDAVVFVRHGGRTLAADNFIIVRPRRPRKHVAIEWMETNFCRI